MPKNVKELMRGKLTKKFLMDLPEGAYLVSNLFFKNNESVYAQKVSPISRREAQWEKNVEASANQRLCYVFKIKQDYTNWLSQMLNK